MNAVDASHKFRLSRLTAADAVLLGARAARAASGAPSLEQAANLIVRELFESLRDDDLSAPATALVRFYRTIAYRDLAPDLQDFAAAAVAPARPAPDVRCLTLMGTTGINPEWNSRHASRGHRAIPLASRAAVERLPMVSRLMSDLGVQGAPYTGTPAPPPPAGAALGRRVFYVAEAAGSPIIPDQDGFVAPHRIRSVIGFGGGLEASDFWAVILFARVPVPESVANLFRVVATDVKIGILPVLLGRFFAV